MNELKGAIRESDNCWRIIPHGYLHDQYQRNEFICPGELSVCAIILSPNGSHRFSVRSNEDEIRLACGSDEHYWLGRHKPWDRAQPFIIIRDPVPWKDISWFHQECELTLLTWLKNSNDPDAWQIPGIKQFLYRRVKFWIKRIGKKKYREQHSKFWGIK